MNKAFNIVLNKLLIIKFYLQRASSYFVFVNSVILLFLLFSKMGLELHLTKIQFILLGIGWLLFMAFVGWLDKKLGLLSLEIEQSVNKDLITRSRNNIINEKLDKIISKLDKPDL